jgi:hypothetical protein
MPMVRHFLPASRLFSHHCHFIISHFLKKISQINGFPSVAETKKRSHRDIAQLLDSALGMFFPCHCNSMREFCHRVLDELQQGLQLTVICADSIESESKLHRLNYSANAAVGPARHFHQVHLNLT